MAPLNVRVIVRLPLNRPDDAREDPPKVEWNHDKEKVLWDVIARSRATDNGGTDWQGLAAHLHVPLPYLLYRAQTRYEEDLRGLQGIKVPDPAAASPSPDHLAPRSTPASRLSGQITSTRLTTPLGLRARLNSLTPAPSNATPKVSSSSVITLQHGPPPRLPRKPTLRSRSSSPDNDSDSDSGLDASEQAERQLEEREALDQKLRNLQTMITGEKLGLVRSSRPRQRTERPSRGPHSTLSNYTSLDSSSPSSASSVGSPQGSIPSIPSPPPERHQVQQPTPRRDIPGKSSSPPALSPRPHPQNFGLIGMVQRNSEKDSNNGSSASSFSDLSDASLSASTGMDSDFVTRPTVAAGPSRLTTLARDSLRRGSRAFHR